MKTTALLKASISVLLVFAAMVFADSEKAEHDYHRVSIFAQPGISFLNFEEREYFQDAIDTIYREFYSQALTESESLTVAKQDFQKVNFCFPITGGIQFQPFLDHFISLGFTFIYDHESVVLTDRRNKSHNYDYTIQGTPLFLEYRMAIPKNLILLSGENLFSVAVRWYWVLPGTEIYSSWGKIDAKTPIYGGGFGISIGYLLVSWHGINIYGDIGYTSIPVESNGTFSDIVPDSPDKKAKWDIGGLQMQFRVSFGGWDYPKIVEDSSKVKSKKGSTPPSVKKESSTDSSMVNATAKQETAKADSSKAGEAVKQEPAKADSSKAGEAVKQETAKADSGKAGEAVKQETAKADSGKAGEAVKQETAKADSGKASEAVKQETAKADSSKAGEAAKQETAKPAEPEVKKQEPQRPAAKKATGP